MYSKWRNWTKENTLSTYTSFRNNCNYCRKPRHIILFLINATKQISHTKYFKKNKVSVMQRIQAMTSLLCLKEFTWFNRPLWLGLHFRLTCRGLALLPCRPYMSSLRCHGLSKYRAWIFSCPEYFPSNLHLIYYCLSFSPQLNSHFPKEAFPAGHRVFLLTLV